MVRDVVAAVFWSVGRVAVCLAFGIAAALAGDVTFEGDVSNYAAAAKLGTFNPDFNPFCYKLTYGIDSVGNMDSPNYTRAVGDGNFRPIGDGSFDGMTFAGVGTATGIEGQQLWLFLFDNKNPDQAQHFALFTGADLSWRAPADGASTHILADSADLFVFGSGGRGEAIDLQGLPMPEPSPLIMLGGGAVLLFLGLRSRGRYL